MVKGVKFLAAVVGALSLGACADSPTGPQRSLAAGGPAFLTTTAAVPGPSTTGVTYPLYAGGGGGSTGTLVGNVTVKSVLFSGNLYDITVTYNLTVGCLNETHLQIALTLAGVPQKNGNPPPGQFANSHSLSTASCITTDSYTVRFDMGSGTDNSVVIAAHSVVRGVTLLFGGGTFVSGSTMPGTVVNHRAGNQAAFTPVSIPLIAAWEPDFNTDPSYWDTVIAADPSGNGAALLAAGADWVWESFRSAHPIEGDVIQANLTVNVPAATTGRFRITCDNGYRVDLNGATITNGGDGATAGLTTQLSTTFATNAGLASNTDLRQANVNAQGWQTVESYNVNLIAGNNLFTLFGVNEYQNLDDSHPGFPGFGGIGIGAAGGDPVGTVDKNPAGCIFGLVANAVRSGEETAWGAPNGFNGSPTSIPGELGGNFPGNNWATWFTYQVR